MKLAELKQKKITVGNPTGDAETLIGAMQRNLDTLWQMNFLKEDFAQPEDWINGACQQENFFVHFYEKRSKLHLSSGFFNEIEKAKIKRMYEERAKATKPYGDAVFSYFKQFLQVCPKYALSVSPNGYIDFKINREELREKHERPLTETELRWAEKLEHIRMKLQELKHLEDTKMAGSFSFKRLQRYFLEDLSEFQPDILMFNFENQNNNLKK